MFKRNKKLSLMFALLAVGFLAIWLTAAPANADSSGADPQAAIEQAWQKAQDSGAYSYRSTVDQTTYPAPLITNAGQSPVKDKVAMAGTINQETETIELTFWQDGSFNPNTGYDVKVEDGKAYGRSGAEPWEEMDNVSESFAPGGDPLGFLAGIDGIQYEGVEQRPIGDSGVVLTLSQYTFELNGPAFAAYLRDAMAEQLVEEGDLPPGIHLDLPDQYQRMTGSGSIWLTTDGLPYRLSVQMALPEQENGERVRADITTDFFDFNLERIDLLSASFFAGPRSWVEARLATTDAVNLWQQVQVTTFFLFLAILIAWVVLRYRHTREFYTGVTLLFIGAMLISPLLRANSVEAFSERQQEDQAASDARQAKADAYADAIASQTESTWNPHQNPQTVSTAKPAAHNSLTPQLSPQFSTNYLLGNNDPITNTVDSDNDGLSDADEGEWGSDILNPDSDGDGLTDGDEVNILGTHPAQADSDGDTITDTLEIQGFSYRGQQWYLDPNSIDTNKDGLPDGLECTTLVSAGICEDTDFDGVPDVFDDDNDNDNVYDSVDISPNTAGSHTFSKDDPMMLEMTNLEVDQPVLVDLVFRPPSGYEDHLTYAGNVMDWPTGDTQGQIQRVLNTTWATTDNPELKQTGGVNNTGDVRLTPVMEIRLPYSSGHYADLPVLDAYAGITRTKGISVEEWLDTTDLDLYGITVQDARDKSGDLLVYVPVTTVSSEIGDETVAFSASMFYFPTQEANGDVDWGTAHEYRLAWFVQMITDQCIDADNDGTIDDEDRETCAREDVLGLIHTYYEPWELTGFQVIEAHGLDVAIMYEDPTNDNLAVDDALWFTSWNLSKTWLEGMDCGTGAPDATTATCEGNEHRDVTIKGGESSDTIRDAISKWITQTTPIQVKTLEYDHEDYFAIAASAEAKHILTSTFQSYATETFPTLLFAQENHQRSVNQDAINQITNNGSAITVDFNNVNVVVRNTMNWVTYQYLENTNEWQRYETSSYLTHLKNQLQKSDEFFSASENDEETQKGKLIWAELYYANLINGASTTVEIDGDLLWQADAFDFEIDETVAAWDGAGIVSGNATVAKIFIIGMNNAQPQKSFFTSFQWDGFSEFWYRATGAADITYRGNFISSSSAVGMSHFLRAGSVLTMGVGAMLLVVGTISNNEATATVGDLMMKGAGLALTVLELGATLYKVSAAGANYAAVVSDIMAGARTTAWTGLLVGLLTTWGLFAATVASQNLSGHSLNFLLAATVASSIILIILFVIAYINIVGLVLVLLLSIIDVLFFFIEGYTLTGKLESAISKFLYQGSTLVRNLADPNRLELNNKVGLIDKDMGFVVGNQLTQTINLSNTIRVNDKESVSRATFEYYLQNSPTPQDEGLKQNARPNDLWIALPYTLTTSTDIENYYARVQHTKTITEIEWMMGRPFLKTETLFYTHDFNETGINYEFRTYLTESFAAPWKGCWFYEDGLFATFINGMTFGATNLDANDCKWYEETGSLHKIVSPVFDIMPLTLSEFVNMGWDDKSNLSIHMADPDGDGLIASNDYENFKWDRDGDGLSDSYEEKIGYRLEDADYDRDGLNDKEELRWSTNPRSWDSDGDGLSDYVEIKRGWLVNYSNGQARVWSDPNEADADGDGFTDLFESYYGFNPNVPTDRSIFQNLVTVENLQINEATDLVMLLPFDEAPGATAFADSAGNDNIAVCTNCPTAGEIGRYGYGLYFDGVNDKLRLDNVSNLDLSDNAGMTVSAWFKFNPNEQHQTIYEQGDDTTGLNIFVLTAGIVTVNAKNASASAWIDGSILNDDEWNHVVVTISRDESTSTDTLELYVNGVNNGSTTMSSGTDIWYQPADVGIGAVNGSGLGPFGNSATDGAYPFSGQIDEVAIFNKALSIDEALEVYQGHYIFNDLIVSPGQELTYQATITNSAEFAGANGFMRVESSYVDPPIGNPIVMMRGQESDYNLPYDYDDALACLSAGTCYFDNTQDIHAATCITGTCPTLVDYGTSPNSWMGIGSKGIALDGVDDVLYIDSGIHRAVTDSDNNHIDLSIALKINQLPAVGERAAIFETADDGSGILPLSFYLNHDNSITLIAGDLSETFEDEDGIFELGKWTKLELGWVFWYSIGRYVYRFRLSESSIDPFREAGIAVDGNIDRSDFAFGTGTIGNSLAGDAPLAGEIGKVSISATYQDSLHNWSVGFGDAPMHNLQLLNPDVTGRELNCDILFVCPDPVDDGKWDQALQFDGVDDHLYTLGYGLDPAKTNITAAAWVYLDDFSQSGTILEHENGATWLAIDASGQLNTNLGGGALSSGSPIPTGEWVLVAVTYEGGKVTLYQNEDIVATGPATAISSSGNLVIGAAADLSGQFFGGRVDNLVVFDSTLEQSGIQALFAGAYPAVHLSTPLETFTIADGIANTLTGTISIDADAPGGSHLLEQEVEVALPTSTTYPKDASITGLYESFDGAYGTGCATCPTPGFRGMVNGAYYFDGVDDKFSTVYGTSRTIAVWVNASDGVILETDAKYGHGASIVRMGEVVVDDNDNSGSFTFDIPKDEWVHLALVSDATYITSTYTYTDTSISLYLNGELATVYGGAWIYPIAKVVLGNSLHGYLDDFRTYSESLTAEEIKHLYEETAPIVHFNFDEEASDTYYADASPNGYIGLPVTETCADLTLNTIDITSYASGNDNVYVALDNEWLIYQSISNTLENGSVNVGATLCGQQTLSVGAVDDNNTISVLGSVTLKATTATTTTRSFNAGGTAVNVTWSADGSTFPIFNPSPGTDGKLGNKITLDGNGYIKLANTETLTDINSLTKSFTIMTWVNPDTLTGSQSLFSTGHDGYKGLSLGLNGNNLRFTAYGVKTYSSSAEVEANLWQHVAIVFDSDRDVSFYLDGALIDTISGNYVVRTNYHNGSSPDPVYIGAMTRGNFKPGQFFSGQLDELALYQRELSTDEIYATYLQELVQYRDRTSATVLIDTDAPTVELAINQQYWANENIALLATTEESSSYVSLVDFGIKAPGESRFHWQAAPACLDAIVRSVAWCPSFDPSLLSGGGTYEIQFRAVDAAGNDGFSDVYTLYVDTTGPTQGDVNETYNNEWIGLTANATDILSWTVPITITLIDNTAITDSGVNTDTVKVSLVDGRGEIIGVGAAQEVHELVQSNGIWYGYLDYALNGTPPSGLYDVIVEAEDNVGNWAKFSHGAIRLDGRAPYAQLGNANLGSTLSETTTLNGVVLEQPNWANAVAQYHFETADPTFDYSGNEHHAACTNCPTGATGILGQALGFDGVDDALTLPVAVNPISHTFSVVAWINPANTSSAHSILSQAGDTGAELTWLGIRSGGLLEASLAGASVNGTTPLTANNWRHVAVTYDKSEVTLYLDGVVEASASITPGASDNAFVVGIASDLTSAPFLGSMDEVTIYNDVLTGDDIYALAQTEAYGVNSVEVGIQEIISGTTPAVTWGAATVNNTGALLSDWAYTINGAYEGLYNLQLRSNDTVGYSQPESVVWQGLIDTVAPRIGLNSVYIGEEATAETVYTFSVEDYLIDMSSLTSSRCSAEDLVVSAYTESDDGVTGGAYLVNATCTVSGHDTANMTVSVCDAVGHCTTATTDPSGCLDSVATEAELNQALTCFNQQPAARTYTVTLTADIDLTASTITITNNITGARLLIDGAGYTVDGGKKFGVRPFSIEDAAVTIENIVVTGGMTSGYGIHGAGLYVVNGDLTINNSSINDNDAGYSDGGGLFAQDSNITVNRVTFYKNWSTNGGAIASFNSVVNVVNSTFSLNRAFYGAAIYASEFSTVTITYNTFAENAHLEASGGAVVYADNSVINIGATILSEDPAYPDCDGTGNYTYNDLGYNVLRYNTCGLSEQTSGAGTALIESLADNGGGTLTYALRPVSPLIDVIPAAECTVTEDQRGALRPEGSGCDIGAYEYGATLEAPLAGATFGALGEGLPKTILLAMATLLGLLVFAGVVMRRQRK